MNKLLAMIVLSVIINLLLLVMVWAIDFQAAVLIGFSIVICNQIIKE